MSHYHDFKFDKEIYLDVDFDLKIDTNINFHKNVDIDFKLDVDPDIYGNTAQVTFDVEAVGYDTFTELDLVVLTVEDELSSISGAATSSVN